MADLLETIPDRMPKRRQLYTYEKAIEISDYYCEGMTLASISQIPEMPSYQTILNWLRTCEEFRDLMQAARTTRAFHCEQKLFEIAEQAPDTHKDLVPGLKLAADIYKWGAEVNDSSKYAKKTTIEGNPDRPITFNIITGFPPLTPEQEQPKLGIDGLVEKASAKVIEAVVVTEDTPEEDQYGV